MLCWNAIPGMTHYCLILILRLLISIQEDECVAEGGECIDTCGCDGDYLHGFCPSQPNSIKCCPKSTSSTASASEPEMCEMETTAATPADCSGIVCLTGDTSALYY